MPKNELSDLLSEVKLDSADERSEGLGKPAHWIVRDPTIEDLPDIADVLEQEIKDITELEILEIAGSVDGFLEYLLDADKMNTMSSTGIWEWDIYQKYYFNCPTWFITNKCRQSGGSAMLAAKYFAKGILSPNDYTAILVSYKKEEAINKIDYVRRYLDALPPRFKKKIIRDPRQLLEFENANGTRVKIMSHAQKPIRGVHGDVGLDELAFYQFADEIYSSAMPATAMVRGNIDIISTPFGMSGKFFEIFDDKRQFEAYQRMQIMWWHCKRYLKDPSPEFYFKAMKEAPHYSTEERVFIFGNFWLQQQFKNSQDLETFQQEFEGYFVDESAAFFYKDLIMSCMYHPETSIDDYLPNKEDFWMDIQEALEDRESELPVVVRIHKETKTYDKRKLEFKKYDSLSELFNAVRAGRVSPNLFGGLDIGTTTHSTDFRIIEEVVLENKQTLHIERFSLNRHKWDLPDQEAYFEDVLSKGMLKRLIADTGGIGKQMGQYLSKLFPGIFIPMQMNPGIKEDIMVNLKSRFEEKSIAVAFDKQLLEDLHSIKKKVTADKKLTFIAEERGKHHADGAWALGFATFGGTRAGNNARSFGMATQGVNVKASPIIPASGRWMQTEDGIVTESQLMAKQVGAINSLNYLKPLGELGSPGTFIPNYDE